MNRLEPIPPERPDVAHPGDVALAKMALDRDPDALRTFSERMRCVPRMLSAKNAELGRPFDDEQLEDLAQDTLCAVWRRLPLYRGRGSLETWIFRFCYFEFLRVLREQRRIPRPLDEPGDTPELSPETAQQEAMDYELVLRCLDELEPDLADVVRLKHFDEKTFDEIGAHLAISPNTVKTRYYRGILRLRRRLSSMTPERQTEARG